jgi:chromosome partitioning protein
MSTPQNLVGLSELADLFGMSKQTISNWRTKPDFPDPVAELRSGPIWAFDSVKRWADANAIQLRTPPTPQDKRATRKAATAVALINMKGGVGKSTLTANLGWFCAYKKNKRVLLVDLDPQFNLSQYVLGSMAYEKHVAELKPTVVDVLEHPGQVGSKRKDTQPRSAICGVRKWDDGSSLDLVPSSLELAWSLKNPHQKEHLLRDFLEEVETDYDLILIDCAPTESVLTHAAYMAADYLLIPVRPEFLAAIGLPLLGRSLKDFQSVYKNEAPPKIAGIIFNDSMDNAEHLRSKAYVRKLAKGQGWHVFDNELSHSDSYAVGARTGMPIFLTDHARSWKIAEFNKLAEEFLTIVPV